MSILFYVTVKYLNQVNKKKIKDNFIMIENIRFIHFLTATAVIELFMVILFRFTRCSSKVINNWYDNLGWTAILLDVL